MSATLSSPQKKPKEVESEAWTSFLRSCTTVCISIRSEPSDIGRRECVHFRVHSPQAVSYRFSAVVTERERLGASFPALRQLAEVIPRRESPGRVPCAYSQAVARGEADEVDTARLHSRPFEGGSRLASSL